jgi:hypothetical protein
VSYGNSLSNYVFFSCGHLAETEKWSECSTHVTVITGGVLVANTIMASLDSSGVTEEVIAEMQQF